MRNIPMFTSEYGVASLFLTEIPYRQRAHIKIQSSLDPEKLLEECIGFCRACGAEWIDAAGHEYLEKFPLITALYIMQRDRETMPQTDACLFPMTEATMETWRNIYNERMADVPNCAWMDTADARKFLQDGDCYFIHRDGKLLGIGKAKDDFIDTVASVVPGMGETVTLALASSLTADTVRLMVAGANERAVRLYERMGFIKVKEVARWHRVF